MAVQQLNQSPQKNQSARHGQQPGARQSASPQAMPDLQRALEDPAQASPAEMLQLQQAAGNRAVSGLIQARLRVGPVGDAYEQEADRMADQVMRSPAPAIQRQAGPEEEEELQAKRRGGGGFFADEQTRQEIASQQRHGVPLPDDLQAEMEAHFGADFSAVRVHAGPQAAGLNRRLRASAFTHQADIYFDSGLYQPGSGSGKRLLAHELTHVIQQGAAGQKGALARPSHAEAAASLPPAHQTVQRDNEDDKKLLSIKPPPKPKTKPPRPKIKHPRPKTKPLSMLPSNKPKPPPKSTRKRTPRLKIKFAKPQAKPPSTLPSKTKIGLSPVPKINPVKSQAKPVSGTTSLPPRRQPPPLPRSQHPLQPRPRNPTSSPAKRPTIIKRPDTEELLSKLDPIVGGLGSSAVGTGSSAFDTLNNWTLQIPYSQHAGFTVPAGLIGSGLSFAKGGLDIGSIYSGARDIYKAYKTRKDPKASPIKKEMAWKKQKGGAKSVGAGLLGLTGDVTGTFSGVSSVIGGSLATLTGSIAGGVGAGVSGVETTRNLWSMGRAAHKAHQLGGWSGKGGLVGEITEKEKKATGGQKTAMQSLGDIAKYAHKHKTRTAILKTLGATGAGLGTLGGVVGGISALAGNPIGAGVGAGLAGAGAAVGLGIGAYKLVRGMWKRHHRRSKLAKAEKALGITRPKEAGVLGRITSFGKWMVGKDIDERRQAIKQKMAATQKPMTPEIERALKTEKQRKTEKLVEHLTSGTDEEKSMARRIGSTLGVLTKEGKVIQSRGWQFWKKKEDLGMEKVNTEEKKEELAELFARKLGN